MAELEHQKLNLKESHDSTSSTESGFINVKDSIKTCFQNIQLNKDTNPTSIKNTYQLESKSNVTAPVFIQPSLKLVNGKSSATNPTVPCYVLNNISTDKTEVKNINMCKLFYIYIYILVSLIFFFFCEQNFINHKM